MPGLLTASQLTALQAAANKTLDKTCDVWRDAGAATPSNADAYGSSQSSPSNTANYSKVLSSVAYSVAEPTATHLQNYDYLIGSEATWLVRMPVGTAIKERDHIVDGADILEVHKILTPRSYAALLSMLCAEIT